MEDWKTTKKEELGFNSPGVSTTSLFKKEDTDPLYKTIATKLWDDKKLFIGWDSEFKPPKEMGNPDYESELYSYQFAWYGKTGRYLKLRFWENPTSRKTRMPWTNFQQLIKRITGIGYTEEWEIYLMCHYSTAEISTIHNYFDNFFAQDSLVDFGKYGTYTFKSTIFKTLKICDTLNFQKSNLAKIGEALGIPKINFQSEVEKLIPSFKENDRKAIEHYGELLINPLTRNLCIEYGLRDCEICLKFALAVTELLYRETGKLIICETLPSASEKIFLEKYIEYEDKKIKVKPKDKNKPRKDKWSRWESLGHEKVVYHPPYKRGVITPSKNPYYRERVFKQIKDLGENIYQGGRNQTYFNGIVKQTCYDFDIKGAYTIPLKLIKGLEFIRTDLDGLPFKKQTEEYSLEQFKKLISKLSDDKIITLQGTFTGIIAYHKNLYITPTLINLKSNLAECLIDNSEHHILELAFILRYYPQIVDWDKTVIRGISLFKTSQKRVFLKYIDYLTEQRSKYPKGSVFNVLYKLLSNSFYGKLAQGIRGDYRWNIITEKKEKIPESRIFNPLFAAYITAYIRLMTFEAVYSINNAHNQDFSEWVLNVITDGCLLTGKRSPDEYINQFNNLPFIKQTREMLGVDSLWELKHKSLNGHIVPKVRIDFPLNYEERWDTDDSDMKIAAPSGYSKEVSKKDIQAELKHLYLENPNEIVPNRRLQSYRDIFETNQLLTSINVDKLINWNLQATKNVKIWLNNEIYNGSILVPYDHPDSATTSYLRNQNDHFKNQFLAYRHDQVEKYMLLNQKEVKLRERTEVSRYAWIVNDLIYALKKKYHLNLTYNSLINELKNKINYQNFKKIKRRTIGYKIQVVNSYIHDEFLNYLNQQLIVLKEENKQTTTAKKAPRRVLTC